MDIKKKYKFYNKVAFCLALIMIGEIAVPTLSLALTSGPASPEFSSFEPVSTTSMVNEFSGSFTYNIPVLEVPGANGGGYACGLSYHSGESVESEASWVGYGWSLNPGAINRSKRGFADDSKGSPVEYINDVPANWTISAGVNAGQIEAFSVDIPVSVGASIRYNNYKGFGYTVTAGYNVGIVSLGYSLSDGDGSFSVNVNPAMLLTKVTKDQKLDDLKKDVKAAKTGADKKKALEAIGKYKEEGGKGDKIEKQKGAGAVGFLSNMGSAYGMHSIGSDLRATSVTPYDGESFNMQVKMDAELLPAPVGVDAGFNANFSRQKNRKTPSIATYGYMYSSEAQKAENKSSMMDYYVEKEATYNKRDHYLSIPFSNADMYGLSGEGLGGGFRLYNKNAGTFFPNEVHSPTTIVQMGAAVELGLDIGVGADLGVGFQTLEVKREWSDITSTNNGNTGSYSFANDTDDESVFFRFNNDMGGSITYANSSSAVKANITPVNDVPGIKTKNPMVATDIYTSISDTVENGSNRSGRSSYVAYHTNAEMGLTANNLKYKSYEKSASTNDLVNRTSDEYLNGIGEFAVYNADGNRYVYGLPVYSRNDTNMQYDLRGVPAGNIHDNYIAYKDISNPFSRVGEISNAPYATTYLLTEITSPDYLDRTMNGPSADDFGGYTKFTYSKQYGKNNPSNPIPLDSWYKWRIPYTGLSYNPRDLTDNLDDMGSVNSGEKEVCYLQKIETKTHIAIFVTNSTNITISGIATPLTGSLKDRQDGIEAADDNTAAKDPTARGSKKMQMLERIELYAKPVTDGGAYKLIKTTHFDYDYSLCGNVPNNFGVADPNNNGEPINSNKGKLTLKKVWFEYEGIHNVKISPYKFDYTYPTININNGIPTTYANNSNPVNLINNGIVGYGTNLSASLENPDYSPFLLDRWGNARPDGEEKQDSLKTHVDQTPSLFDPAAWQMKKITLPSGGEILVQYEQNEYRYVQDRRALAMVSLKRVSGDVKVNKFYLNVDDDLGVTSLADKQKLVEIIRDEYKDKKIYFKYLYALVGGNPQLGNCNSDYVDGYVNVKTVDIDPSNNFIYIKLGDGNAFNGNSYELPRNVCIDYVKHEKAGKLKPVGNCNADEGGIKEGNDPIGVAQQLLQWIVSGSLPQSTCLDLNESLSYLRIPLLNAKKGGGIRVKRILMHDKGIETGDEALYGSEYFYTDIDGGSSGVATNEPSAGKEENALVTYLDKRSDQGFLNRITSGKDKEQAEGPLGEYLLPSPSVGYARVVVKNIHSDKTNTGFVVNEFFTAKDYPFDRRYNTSEVQGGAVDYTPIQNERDYLPVPAPFFSSSIDNLWLSQGYRFVINEMHGQQKSIATYGGDLTLGVPSTTLLSSKQEFTYFEPGEKIPLMVNEDGTIRYGNPGKETEVVMERKAVEDICKNGKIEGDFSIGLLPPVFPVFVSASGSASYTESKLRTHTTTKIVRYPAIQKSVTSFQDGIYHINENIAFSPTTGKPSLTKTSDGYDKLNLQQASPNNAHDGSYYTCEIPASSQYKEMGQKAMNERKILYSSPSNPLLTLTLEKEGTDYFLKFEVPSGAPSGTTVCGAMNSFVRGDLIRTNGNEFFHTDEKAGSRIKLLPAQLYTPTPGGGGAVASVEIIRSGKTNQLSTNVGSYTTYGPKQTVETTTFTDSPEMQSRIQIAGTLSYIAALPNYTGPISFGGYNNLIRYDDGISCNPINDANHPFSMEYSGNQFTVKILKKAAWVEELPMPQTDVNKVIRLANDLNTYVAKIWGFNGESCDATLWDGLNKNSNTTEYLFGSDLISVSSLPGLIANCEYPLQSNIVSNSTAHLYGNNVQSIQFFPDPINAAVRMQCEGTIPCNTGKKNDVKGVRYSDFNFVVNDIYGRQGKFKVHMVRNANLSYRFDVNGPNPNNNAYNSSAGKDFLTTTNLQSVYNYSVYNNFTTHCGIFEANNDGYLYFRQPNGSKTVLLIPPPKQTVNHPDEYYTHTFTKGGHFDVDPNTGQLVYFDPTNPCYSQKVNFNFCNPASGTPALRTVNKVVASSASTYSDNWPFPFFVMSNQSAISGNVYETGEKGKWRMNSTYAYNENITGGSKSNERNYNDAGTYPMALFNWKKEGANDSHWIRATTVTRYSPNGEAIEENDVLNIKSTAKYGYKGMLPYLIAKNADYSTVHFESFENVYSGYKLEESSFTNGATIDNQLAHSGKSSLKLRSGADKLTFSLISLTDQIKAKGLSIKVWVKSSDNTGKPIEAKLLDIYGFGLTASFTKVAQTGAWTLYEAKVAGPSFNAMMVGLFTIDIQSKSVVCWVDDIRIQPMDSQVMTYVYDNTTMRLLASFDDQHFGLFYQYNAEGKLVRKLVETERGTKTIQETQYHTPLVGRGN